MSRGRGAAAGRVRLLAVALAAAAAGVGAPAVAAELQFGLDRDGFHLGTPGFQLRLRSVIQADGRAYLDQALQPSDTFLIRRARLYIEGSVGDFLDYRLMPDFAGGQVQLFDAWVTLRPWPWLQLRAGKFKTPFGLERLQLEQNLVFTERGLTSNLAPDRDVGVLLMGELWDRTLRWAAGVIDGAPDGGSVDIDDGFGKDYVARLFAQPLRPLHRAVVAELGIGLAATYGHENGTPSSPGLLPMRSDGQLVFFTWRNDPKALSVTVAAGERWRVTPQLYWYVGPIALLAEYVWSSTAVVDGDARARVNNQAWNIELSGMITGEHPTYEGMSPRRPFSVKRRQLGALEVGVRVDELRVDPAVFPRFADPATSARRAFSWTLQLNWYLTMNVRFALMYTRTSFDGGAAAGDRPTEDALLGRLQMSF